MQDILLDSPADQAGMRAGDTIVAVNDQEVKDSEGLLDVARQAKRGDDLRLQILRAGKPERKAVNLTLGGRPAKPLAELPRKERPALGIAFSIADDGRLRIAELQANSAAEQAGLKLGDVVISVAGHEVTNYVTLLSLIAARQPGDEVKIRARRDGELLEHTAKLK